MTGKKFRKKFRKHLAQLMGEPSKANLLKTILARLTSIEKKLDQLTQYPAEPYIDADSWPNVPSEMEAPPIPNRVDGTACRIPGMITGYWLERTSLAQLPPTAPFADPDGAIIFAQPDRLESHQRPEQPWLALDFRRNGKPWRYNPYELNQCIHLSTIGKGRTMMFATYHDAGEHELDKAWLVTKLIPTNTDMVKTYWPQLMPLLHEVEPLVALVLAPVVSKGTMSEQDPPTQAEADAAAAEKPGGIFGDASVIRQVSYGYPAGTVLHHPATQGGDETQLPKPVHEYDPATAKSKPATTYPVAPLGSTEPVEDDG